MQDRLKYYTEQSPIDASQEDYEWITIATDLQQTQPVPKLNNQSSFFKQKVSKNLFFLIIVVT